MKLGENLPFYEAFRLVQFHSEIRYIRMSAWNKDVEIHVQVPNEHEKMTHPFLYVKSRFGLVPWNPTQVELFSKTWEVYEYSNDEK